MSAADRQMFTVWRSLLQPMHSCRNFCFLFASLLLAGCASVDSFKGIAIDDDGVYVSGLPPIKQDDHYACGAACAAAVATFWNVPLAEFSEKHPMMTADMTGHELQVLGEELELRAFAYRGSMEDLQENLHKGRPVIVMIPQPLIPGGDMASALLFNAWNKWGPKPAHWVVVVGIDKNKNVIMHDPASGPMVMKAETFQLWWGKKGNLSVLYASR